MHDRRIDGVPHIFGNAGSLFMSAMTWYDHETRSIWSQPWGRAIIGEYKGVQLHLLPSQLTTWRQWRASYPHTLAMANPSEYLSVRPQGFSPDFVIGVIVSGEAKAYYYMDVEGPGAINDTLGELPVLVWARDGIYQAYLRVVNGRTLTFSLDGDELVDEETGSRWDPHVGRALSGPLEGEALRPIPSLSSFDWAWMDFYPTSEFYRRDGPHP